MGTRNYEYRIYPKRRHISCLRDQFQLSKALHNILLANAKMRYHGENGAEEDGGKPRDGHFSRNDMNRFITELKEVEPSFREVHSQVLQNTADRLSKSFQAFYRRCRARKSGKRLRAGFPRRKIWNRSITYPQSGFKALSERRLYISKVGNVPIVLHRKLKGKVKTMTIKHTRTNKWFVVFSCEVDEEGTDGHGPRTTNRKAILRLARHHERIANQRRDFHHKESRRLVDIYGLIAVEDLNIKRMMGRMGGGIRKGPRLAKHMTDAGWGGFLRMLEYKAESANARFVAVDPRGTTQECSECGEKVPKGLDERVHRCPRCGLVMPRDQNSAKVILMRAIPTVGRTGSDACGDLANTGRSDRSASRVVEAGTICDKG